MFENIDQAFRSLPLPVCLLILIGAFGIIAVIAVKTRHLTVDGAIVAAAMGVTVTATTGFGGLLLLFAFYVSSNLIGKLRKKKQASEGNFIEKKGNVRDAVQVLSNGFPAVLSGELFALTKNPVFLVMFGAALAEATADTWAGEIGRLSKEAPRSIITKEVVEKGESGGITSLGTFAALAAAMFIGLLWLLIFRNAGNIVGLLIIAAGGFFGAVLDSVLGAKYQALYIDPVTGQKSETPVGKDGKQYELCRGLKWLDNDRVNFLSNIAAVLFAGAAGWLISLL